MVVVYDKKTGEAKWFTYPVDAAEAVSYGHCTYNKPETDDKVPERLAVDLDEVTDIAERYRVGAQVLSDEVANLRTFQASEERESPQSLEPPAAPESKEVADTFNPATASRAELFEYLRGNDIDVGNHSGTETLRAEAVKVFLKPIENLNVKDNE